MNTKTDPKATPVRTERVRYWKPIERPSWVSLRVRAWLAVHDGMRVDEYLGGRKAAHLLDGAPNGMELPRTVTVSSGAVEVSTNPHFCSGALVPQVDVEFADVPELRMQRARPDHASSALQEQRRIHEAHERTEAAKQVLSALRDAQAASASVGFATPAAGRPIMPRATMLALYVAGIVVAVLCEGYQFALPLLDQNGIDSRTIGDELQRAPTQVVTSFLFAFSFAFGLWAVVDIVGSGLRAFATGTFTVRTACFKALGLVLGTGFLMGATWTVAVMRHSVAAASAELATVVGHAANEAQTVGFWMIMGVFALMVEAFGHRARMLLEERRAVQAAQRAWDEARDAEAREASVRAGREAVGAANIGAAERNVEVAGQHYEDLVDAACEAEEALAAEIMLNEQYAQAFIDSLVAVLELERAAFVRSARRSGRLELLEVAPPMPPKSAVHLPVSSDQGSRIVLH